MKQLLCIFLLILNSVCYGQSPTYIGGTNSSIRTRGGLRIDSGGVQLPMLNITKKYTTGALDTNSLLFTNSVDSLPVYMKGGLVKKVLTVFDSSVGYVAGAEVGHANGVAPLNGSGIVPSANLPAITISGQVFIDNSQAQMLAHAGATAGALSVRADSNSVLLVLTATPSNVRANWVVTQGNGVSAFNGRTGAINPRSGDYGTDSVVEGINNKYFTNARAQSVIASDTGSSGFLVNTAKLADTALILRGLITGSSANLAQVLTSGNTAGNTISLGKKVGPNAFSQAKLGVTAGDSSGTITLSDSSVTNNIFMSASASISSISGNGGNGAYAISASTGAAVINLAVGSRSSQISNTAISFTGGVSYPNFLNSATGVAANQLHGTGPTPSITVAAAAGGSGSAVSLSGSDVAGYVTITTGVSPTTGIIASVTFANAFSSNPKYVVISPANLAAAGLVNTKQAYVDQVNINNLGFSISSNSTALAGDTSYKWYYLVIN